MLFASLPQWSSALVGILRGANNASDVTEIPSTVTVTALIGLCVLCQLEYINGIIATLTVLEAPTAQDGQEVGGTTSDKDGHSDNLSDLRLFYAKHMLNSLKTSLVSILAIFVVYECLWRAGVMATNPQRTTGGNLSIIGIALFSMIARPLNSNAVAQDRRRVRQLIYRQGMVWKSLHIFVPYMGVFLAMAFATQLDAGRSFPVYVGVKWILALLLTNIHTAWVHTAISNSSKSLWQRIPDRQAWLAMAPVASLDILLPEGVYYITKTVLSFWSGTISVEDESASPLQFYSVALVPVFLRWLTTIWTRAIYVKVAASLLAGDDQPVLSFDRKHPKTDRLSILDAIKGISINNWHRYSSIVLGGTVYEYLWVGCSSIVLIAQLHYLAPCAVMDLVTWYTKDCHKQEIRGKSSRFKKYLSGESCSVAEMFNSTKEAAIAEPVRSVSASKSSPESPMSTL